MIEIVRVPCLPSDNVSQAGSPALGTLKASMKIEAFCLYFG